jgi:hypothetical protein
MTPEPQSRTRLRLPRHWPVLLIALPAAVSIWGGWVGLGAKAGFGPVNLLPGFGHGLTFNTAITLPVGVEAYGSYALGAWLSAGTPERARRFARASAIGSLGLGMLGQVAYHLLAAAHDAKAPGLIIVLVACLPVVTLGFAAALTHLLRAGAEAAISSPSGLATTAPHLAASTPGDLASTSPSPEPEVAIASPRDLATTSPPEHASTSPAPRQKRGTSPSAERARKAAEARRLMAADPALTLGQVAAKSGVSERTASRIRSESQPPLRVAER